MMSHKVGGVVVNNTDNILISSFVGVHWVGLYSNYVLISGMINSILYQIFTVLTASVGNLNVTESKEKSKQILCAHELGHIVLGHKGVNNFEADDLDAEREANLFALYMLFDESEFDIKFENMSNYLIKYTLDKNIILASK